jgi:O-antigen ligase
MAKFAALGCVLVVMLLSVLAVLGYGDLFFNRVIASARLGDMEGTSSGRLQIWQGALAYMFEHPLSLVTGFGFNAYNVLPFRLAPHNYYLAQWFNLGLIGLVCSIGLLYTPIRHARLAVAAATPEVRVLLIAFVAGALAYAIATFFVDLFAPWLYFWAYTGIVMRLAVQAHERAPTVAAEGQQPVKRSGQPQVDPFGWTRPVGGR